MAWSSDFQNRRDQILCYLSDPSCPLAAWSPGQSWVYQVLKLLLSHYATVFSWFCSLVSNAIHKSTCPAMSVVHPYLVTHPWEYRCQRSFIQVSGTLAGGDSEDWRSEDVKARGQWCQPLPPCSPELSLLECLVAFSTQGKEPIDSDKSKAFNS